MLMQPFLTELDSRAQVKGSVDPLGGMAIWTHLGRRVVGNLTTVSASVADFKTLLIGFGLIAEIRAAGRDSGADDLAMFLRWEQLAAYARHRDGGFRGIERVRKRVSESSGTVPIAATPDAQILGNQKTYGIWGLYIVPSRASGLLHREFNQLTPAAREYLAPVKQGALSTVWGSILKTARGDTRRFSLARNEQLLTTIRNVLTHHRAEDERAFWARHLVKGGPDDTTSGRQALLAEVLAGTPRGRDFVLSPQLMRSIAEQVRGRDATLAANLDDITAAESVLSVAAALYAYLQTRDGQRRTAVLDAIETAWPRPLERIARDEFAKLRAELISATHNPDLVARWVQLAGHLHAGQWGDVLDGLLGLNAAVMAARGGSPWIEDQNGTLRVRYVDDAAPLPGATDLGDLWRNPYFIQSLRSVVAQLEAT